ncbi:hypothetical protein [Microbacterium sp. W4I20]|uniref:hypothetical protein n=1 Tax=Microbacterium sp. W4I20 TaxID=3042262 RepID=UPI00278493DF|nr:hypothetical protein [Microbacterium sp. W4I20]MDQ0727110.1 hypothetical protein [Microbacterium sp. W4I20]
MFEHPYLTLQSTTFDQEQIAQAAERRRFLLEHADQIVPRPAGPVRRMLRRVLGRKTDAAGRAPAAAVAGSRPGDRAAGSRASGARSANGCEPIAASAP